MFLTVYDLLGRNNILLMSGLQYALNISINSLFLLFACGSLADKYTVHKHNKCIRIYIYIIERNFNDTFFVTRVACQESSFCFYDECY